MKKLQLDHIRVESFVTSDASVERGTVRGREDTTVEEEPIGTDAFTCTCESKVTWIGPPAACCAL